jgi:hypothetical protein
LGGEEGGDFADDVEWEDGLGGGGEVRVVVVR